MDGAAFAPREGAASLPYVSCDEGRGDYVCARIFFLPDAARSAALRVHAIRGRRRAYFESQSTKNRRISIRFWPERRPEVFVDRLMFEPLLSADPSGSSVPILATAVPSQANGGISRDGLTISYRLRHDVRWTDGVPVTARDVIFSWRAIENPNNDAVSRHGYDDVRSIVAPEAYSVVVHLKRPFAPFVNTFFAESDQPYDIVPAHVLARYHDFNQVPFDAAPTVSDGPFRFERWDRGDQLVLGANSGFFKGKPGLRRIEVKFVPNGIRPSISCVRITSTTSISRRYRRIPRCARFPMRASSGST